MMEKLVKYRFIIILGVFALLEVIAILLAPSWYDNTTFLNTLLFIGVSYLAISPFWGEHHHPIWGIMWSLLVMGPLPWFFGIIEVLLYWYLFFHRKNRTRTAPAQSETASQEHQEHPEVLRMCARVPILRIPMPWIIYELRPKMVRRTCWFHEDDPEPFKYIENFEFSGLAIQAITGTTRFQFKCKKFGDNALTIWKNMPVKFAQELDYQLLKD